MKKSMYRLTSSAKITQECACILRLADNAFIPPDPANTDYQAYLEWVAQGGVPEPAPEPAPVPELTPAEKLASSGLTVAELKDLLGLT